MFVVVLIEITVAVALLFRRTAARAGQVAEVTLVLFTVFLVLLQHAGVAVSDCACFGSDVIVNAPEHYAINVSLLVIARRVQCMDVLGSEERDSIRRGE